MEFTDQRVVAVPIKYLYQMLIAECRYGYTRNNHLSPGIEFSHVEELIPLMFESDPEFAIAAARQLADECIEEFYKSYGNNLKEVDDNFQEYVKFIQFCLDFTIQAEVKQESKYSETHRLPGNLDRFIFTLNQYELTAVAAEYEQYSQKEEK